MTTPGPNKVQEVQERLAELLANGWTVPILAEAFGVAQSTMYLWLKDGPTEQRAPLVFMALAHRMFRRSPSRINAYKVLASHDRLEALIEREWTIQVIAEILGTHRSMVSRWRHRGTGSRDRVIALALDNPVFDRSPPKQRRYGPKP